MRDYELTLVVDPEMTASGQKTFLTKIKKLISGQKGKVVKTDEWGKKELVYPIGQKNTAHFFLLTVKLPETVLTEVRQKLSLNEALLRYLLVKKESK